MQFFKQDNPKIGNASDSLAAQQDQNSGSTSLQFSWPPPCGHKVAAEVSNNTSS